MKKILPIGLAAALLGGTAVYLLAPVAGDVTKADRTPAEIGEIVRSYLLENPEILMDVQSALEIKRQNERQQVVGQVIDDAGDLIFKNSRDGVIGNPDAEITIVEFFDYNCGYCKVAMQHMDNIVKNDSNVRFVLKELPILSEDSDKAHMVSAAFQRLYPQKYPDFHRTLLGGKERANEDTAIKAAISLGADEAELRAEMKNPDIVEGFKETFGLMNALQITGTPAYVIGNEVISGAIGEAGLKQKYSALKN